MEPALPPMPPDSPRARVPIPAGAAHMMQFPMPAHIYDNQQGYMGMLPPAMGMDGDSADDPARDGDRRRARRPRGRRRRRGRGGGNSEEDEDDDEDDEETAPEPPEYFPVGAEDFDIFFGELGDPTPQHRCFGCRYAGQNRSGKFSDIAIKNMFALMAEGIGVAWPPALAVEISLLQESYRKQVNANLKPNQTKVPKWKPATILEHWLLHTADPEIRQWLQMMRIQKQVGPETGQDFVCETDSLSPSEMYNIERRSMNVRSRYTGRIMAHKDQTMVWSRLLHDWWFVSAKDPRKFSYFNEGSMFNRKSVTTPGGFVTNGRPIFDFYGSAGQNKRRRTVDQQQTE